MNENDAIAMLGALSQSTRLQIVRHLIGRGATGASAGEIADGVGAIASNASFHLAALEKADLVTSERVSRRIIYRAKTETIGALIAFLLNDCCANDPEVMACCGLASAQDG